VGEVQDDDLGAGLVALVRDAHVKQPKEFAVTDRGFSVTWA